MTPRRASEPGVLDALALLTEIADEVVVRTARDTHEVLAERAHVLARRVTGGRSALPEAVHRQVVGSVYGGLGLGLRTLGAGLDRAAAAGVGPRLADGPRGRFAAATANGLIGDRLLRERPHLAFPMAVRAGGRDVPLDAAGLAAHVPAPTGQVVVWLHGLCADESAWGEGSTCYPEALAADGWTSVRLRANTGLGLRENGAALASLLDRLAEHWPTRVERLVLVGHSLGGLVLRAAGAVAVAPPPGRPAWTDLVSDVVTLGTPHHGAPLAAGVGLGSRGLGRLSETAALGRVLDVRSQGVLDLVAGLGQDVAPLPHARYRLVAGTLTASPRHPVAAAVGDGMVRVASAHGRDRHGRSLFPGGDTLHVGSTGHLALLRHPEVLRALRGWLA